MYYALPDYLQETTLLLLMACCLFIRRQTAGWGLVVGFSIVFRRQRTTHTLACRQAVVLRTYPSLRKGHRRDQPAASVRPLGR